MTRLALLVVLLPQLARAASPTVAVMPFKDLSGERGSIGEAIRETVTTDLKDVGGLRVIERAHVDQVLAEQNLQAARADLDPLSTVKVGKLLGASLIVAGAYQKAAANVRLTARFVDVQTGEIRGTAKVDGQQVDFLKLQDRITTELLRSAGLEPKKVELFARRPRPRLRSLKTIELYGDAVVEKDDARKRKILELALNEDPGFTYASRDLDALEARLKQYDTAYQRETERALRELKQQLSTEKDPQKLSMAYMQVFTKLQMQRRWYSVAALARDVIAHPPPPSPWMDMGELAGMYLVIALFQVRDFDGVLREGEKFLAAHPSSSYFMTIRSQMDQAIARKREMVDGEHEAAAEIAALPPAQQGDPCKLGQVLKQHHQWKRARAELDGCLTGGRSRMPPGVILTLLLQTAAEEGDWAAARRYLDQLKGVDPNLWKSMSAYGATLPSDG